MNLITFLASVHDIGKANIKFQQQNGEGYRHDIGGCAFLMNEHVIELFYNGLGLREKPNRKTRERIYGLI